MRMEPYELSDATACETGAAMTLERQAILVVLRRWATEDFTKCSALGARPPLLHASVADGRGARVRGGRCDDPGKTGNVGCAEEWATEDFTKCSALGARPPLLHASVADGRGARVRGGRCDDP